jgi:PAS domain S-box-containing protein
MVERTYPRAVEKVMRSLEVDQAPVRQEVALLSRLLDALPYPLFWKGRDLRYLGCNAAFARIAGLAFAQEVVGRTDYELPWRKEDCDFFRACDSQVLESGMPLLQCEVPMHGIDGLARWTQTSKVPLRDSDGTVLGVLGILVDVDSQREAQAQMEVAMAAGEAANALLKAQVAERETMQRALADSELRLRDVVETLEAELEQTRAQLLQVERLATLGTLAAGVGHEMRNIATVLNSLRSSFAECATLGAPPSAEELAELGWACEHVATHGKHLMDLGRPGVSTVELLDLRDVVMGSLAMLRTAGVTKHLRVLSTAPQLPVCVEASRTRVEQVLLNLVRNAADAVESLQGRSPEIHVRLFEDREAGFACCSVEDNGVGIPAGQLSSIFDPWFTTKPRGKGTGLGLPVVRTLLQESGGSLSVESREGQGSAFTFRLPLASLKDA